MRQPEIYDVLLEGGSRGWDIEHYLRLTDGITEPIVELGVGTGRLFTALARSDRDIYGVDNNANMLSRALAKSAEQGIECPDSRLLLGDATTMKHDLSFGAVLATYNFLALVPPARLAELMASISAHIAPGGFFGFDVIVADHLPWAAPPHRWANEEVLQVDGVPVAYHAVGTFDPSTRIHTIEETLEHSDGERLDERLELYQWRLDELESQMNELGWFLDRPALDSSGKPFSVASKVFCGVARERRSNA